MRPEISLFEGAGKFSRKWLFLFRHSAPFDCSQQAKWAKFPVFSQLAGNLVHVIDTPFRKRILRQSDTRSLLPTDQKLAGLDSALPGVRMNSDGGAETAGQSCRQCPTRDAPPARSPTRSTMSSWPASTGFPMIP